MIEAQPAISGGVAPGAVDVTVTTVAGTSPLSPHDRITLALVPTIPSGLAVKPGDQRATVHFRPDTGFGTPITYTVTPSPAGTPVTGVKGPIVVPGLRNGTRYTFTVKASDVVGTSAPTAPSKAITPYAPPTLTGLSMSGLTTGKPALHFELRTSSNAPRITSLTVRLPAGLSFTRSLRAVEIRGESDARRETSRGRLTISLPRPPVGLSVRIPASALHETRTLRRRAIASHSHRHGGRLSLRIQLVVTDAAPNTSHLTVTRTVG
jgi:hypothetical protein